MDQEQFLFSIQSLPTQWKPIDYMLLLLWPQTVWLVQYCRVFSPYLACRCTRDWAFNGQQLYLLCLLVLWFPSPFYFLNTESILEVEALMLGVSIRIPILQLKKCLVFLECRRNCIDRLFFFSFPLSLLYLNNRISDFFFFFWFFTFKLH